MYWAASTTIRASFFVMRLYTGGETCQPASTTLFLTAAQLSPGEPTRTSVTSLSRPSFLSTVWITVYVRLPGELKPTFLPLRSFTERMGEPASTIQTTPAIGAPEPEMI